MVSVEISKRLQEGWTLLNEHCPMPGCGTPLLRDHKKEMYCAKCKMYCISADKAKSLGTPDGELDAPGATGEEPASVSRSTFSESAAARASAGRELPTDPPEQQPLAARAETKRSRAAAEALMGEKLLQGWTMLAEECPTTGCCFPLMRDRRRNTTCVACGGDGSPAAAPATAATDEGVDGRFADPPAVAAPASTVSTPPPAAPTARSSSSSGGGGAPEDPEPVVSEEAFAAVRKKRDALSASLGRYMLQGWSLLDRTCPREGCEPGTPLLKDRNTGTFFCAGCDTRMREGDTGGLVVDSAEEAPGATGGSSLKRSRDASSPVAEEGAARPAAPVEAEPMQAESEYELVEVARLRKQAAREQSNDGGASATLAQRLLQGWAMLSATCPEQGCHNPLMRDRSGKEQCVTCCAGGAAASSTPRHQPAAAAEVAAAAAAASAAVPVQAAGDFAGEMETEDEDDQAMLDGGAGRVYAERRMEELLAASAAGPAAEGKMARAATSDAEDAAAVDRSRVRSQALDTLYRALDLSQRRLRACSSSPSSSPESFDVNESLRQADLVARLAVAARAVLDLPSGS